MNTPWRFVATMAIVNVTMFALWERLGRAMLQRLLCNELDVCADQKQREEVMATADSAVAPVWLATLGAFLLMFCIVSRLLIVSDFVGYVFAAAAFPLMCVAGGVLPPLIARQKARHAAWRKLIELGAPLCARCGYRFEGLDLTTVTKCPECGAPVNARPW